MFKQIIRQVFVLKLFKQVTYQILLLVHSHQQQLRNHD